MHASDAKLIGELDSTYLSADNKDALSVCAQRGKRLAISTPNADYLPYVNLGRQVISMCVDGRWGAEDWGQWPQWYFDGQEHFAYVLRKPPANELGNHPFRRLWWNMSEFDWRQDPCLNYGLLLPSIIEEFWEIRRTLMMEVEACLCANGRDYQKLQQIAANMRQCVATLRFTPQPFLGALLTVTAAQRYCLETRAMLDMIKSNGKSFIEDEYPPANNALLGCITDRVPILYKMYEKGVPVWYVRPSSEVSGATNIVAQFPTVRPAQVGIEMKRWPGAPIFYQGPLSREIHAGIQDWKPGNLQLNLLTRGSGAEVMNEECSKAPQASTSKGTRVQPYSKNEAAVKVSTKKPRISVNRELFNNVDSPYMSKPLKAWKKALADVQVDTNRIIQHPDSHLFRGYAFPPPHMFCGEDDVKLLEYMLGWLVVCTSWMGTLGDSKSHAIPLPTPQQWRTYLRGVALGLELVRPDNRKKPSSSPAKELAHSTRWGAKLKEAAREIFTIFVPSQKALSFLIWHDRIVWRRDELDFPELHRKLLVWDAQEHNFCLELLTLDQLIMAKTRGIPGQNTSRNQKVNALWTDGVILMAELQAEPSGIAAVDWRKRCSYVKLFRSIIADWPGDIPKLLSGLSCKRRVGNKDDWDLTCMEHVEKLAAAHYCQAFFDHFGRAPCIPHVFPVA